MDTIQVKKARGQEGWLAPADHLRAMVSLAKERRQATLPNPEAAWLERFLLA
jgi:hypothetical protein